MDGQVTLKVEFAAGTDLGCKRSNNEDSFGYDLQRQLFVVCDGMGGMAAGEVASATAVRELVNAFDTASTAQEESVTTLPLEERLAVAIRAANHSVRAAAVADQRLLGMGTTLVCACLEGNRIVIGNVGDSRAYFLRDGQCVQITQDHSLLAEQLAQGLITPEMAAASPMQSVIVRAVGVEDSVEPDLFAAEVQGGDMLLLTTDGLTRYVADEEIGAILSAQEAQELLCQKLIEQAKQRGGADNITCIVMWIVPAA